MEIQRLTRYPLALLWVGVGLAAPFLILAAVVAGVMVEGLSFCLSFWRP